MSFFYWWRAHNPFETDEGVDEDAIDDKGGKDGKKQDEVFQLYIWHVLIRRGCCGEMNGIFERSDFINSLCWETEVLLRPRGGRGNEYDDKNIFGNFTFSTPTLYGS